METIATEFGELPVPNGEPLMGASAPEVESTENPERLLRVVFATKTKLPEGSIAMALGSNPAKGEPGTGLRAPVLPSIENPATDDVLFNVV